MTQPVPQASHQANSVSALIAPLGDRSPLIDASVFVAATAVVIGDVQIGAGSSVWYGCILRGDEERIVIGELTNIQDGTIIHTTNGEGATVIGSRVTIGHRAVLHGCRIDDDSMIGIGAIILDGAVIEVGAIVAAGAVVTPRTIVSSGYLWSGCPARPQRPVKPAEQLFVEGNPGHYKMQGALHRKYLP